MNYSAKVRALVACCALALCFTGFSARLVHLQVAMHEQYSLIAQQKHVNKQIIYAPRGRILDINGEVMADNDPVRTVLADASLISDPEDAAAVMAGPLGLDEGDLRAKLSSGRRFIVLKKDVSVATATQLETRLSVRAIRGISFQEDADRIYPNGSMACHVVGFMNGDHQGVAGIEAQEDIYLRGHEGFRYTERDRTGRSWWLTAGKNTPRAMDITSA